LPTTCRADAGSSRRIADSGRPSATEREPPARRRSARSAASVRGCWPGTFSARCVAGRRTSCSSRWPRLRSSGASVRQACELAGMAG